MKNDEGTGFTKEKRGGITNVTSENQLRGAYSTFEPTPIEKGAITTETRPS